MLVLSAVLVSSTALYWMYYRSFYGKKPFLSWKEDGKWCKFLSKYVPFIGAEYWSFYFMPGGKFQTIISAILPRKHAIDYERELVLTPDGGQFLLAWSNKSNLSKDEKAPIVFIYPGLVSTTNSMYVNRLTATILDRGYTAVVMVNRGLEAPCLTAKTFCATHTIDLELAVSKLKKSHPHSPIIAIGISLGGLVLTRYLALKGRHSNVQAAFVYSCPFNPVLGSASLEKWDNWLLYNMALTKSLKAIYMKYHEKFVDIVNHDKMMDARSIRDVDTHFTAKVFGYESVDHYYEDAVITKEMINSIRTPTLCLNSDDDAFAPATSLPLDAIRQSDFVALAMTSGGGHVSHLCGINPFSTPYYIDMFLNFLTAVLKYTKELPSCSS